MYFNILLKSFLLTVFIYLLLIMDGSSDYFIRLNIYLTLFILFLSSNLFFIFYNKKILLFNSTFITILSKSITMSIITYTNLWIIDKNATFYDSEITLIVMGLLMIPFIFIFSFSIKNLIIITFTLSLLSYITYSFLEYQDNKKQEQIRAKNPYNGIYNFDITKINNSHIKKDIIRAEELNTATFVLNIDGVIASLYGYQTQQPIRVPYYNVCIKKDKITLTNTTSNIYKYCQIKNAQSLKLEFKVEKNNPFVLICKECEKHGFPPIWIHNKNSQ